MAGSTNVTVEGFISDYAFVDRARYINGFLTEEAGKVGALTSKALSYFNTPAVFTDRRLPADRQVNWVAQSAPQMVVDSTVFAAFVQTMNNIPSSVPVGFFDLIDKLMFNYKAGTTRDAIEAALLADPDIAAIYVPGTYNASTVIVSDTVYLDNGVFNTVSVPSFVGFQIRVTSGSVSTNYILKLYTSVDAFLLQYNQSKVVKVIPPLPFDKLYAASLTNSTDNIFVTASTTTLLSYTSTQNELGVKSVSGIAEYKAVLIDGPNSATLPFNLLFKGRMPTLFEIRTAIKDALLGSGVGNEAGWKKRIPGVFVTGRFYVVPLYDQTFTKPDQVIYPRISGYRKYAELTNKILGSLGYGDSSQYIDVFQIRYNRMTATAIPDMSGAIDVSQLRDLIPDYQDYSTTDEQYSYMTDLTKLFSKELNTVLAVDAKAQTSDIYTINTEGVLKFYSFTIGTYEVCVISKQCYDTVLESTQ